MIRNDLLKEDPTWFISRSLVDMIVTVVILIIGDKGIFKGVRISQVEKLSLPYLYFSLFIFSFLALN